MPKSKRPRDVNQRAKSIVDIATGEKSDPVSEDKPSIHRRIDELMSEVLHLQKTLAILGLPEYWPGGNPTVKQSAPSSKERPSTPTIEDPTPTTHGTKPLREVVLDAIKSNGRPMGVDNLHELLHATALAHETDERIRRRKLSQAIYANKDKLKALQGGGGRQGYTYGLKEWFDGAELKPEHRKK